MKVRLPGFKPWEITPPRIFDVIIVVVNSLCLCCLNCEAEVTAAASVMPESVGKTRGHAWNKSGTDLLATLHFKVNPNDTVWTTTLQRF